MMNDEERLMLQKMIKANDVEDQSEMIRKLKHSHPLQKDINRLLQIKQELRDNEDEVHAMASQECSFLFNGYTDIFNKIKKNEISLSILNRFLNILRNIEDGDIDQHEGSYIVGTLLKELYIDSALKKADKLNKDPKKDEFVVARNISFRQFKEKTNSINIK
jgi:hypothetical protein